MPTPADLRSQLKQAEIDLSEAEDLDEFILIYQGVPLIVDLAGNTYSATVAEATRYKDEGDAVLVAAEIRSHKGRAPAIYSVRTAMIVEIEALARAIAEAETPIRLH